MAHFAGAEGGALQVTSDLEGTKHDVNVLTMVEAAGGAILLFFR